MQQRLKAESALAENRAEDPRTILQGAHRFQLLSRNYNLLVALLSRIEEGERPAFLQKVADRLRFFPGSMRNRAAGFPSWSSQTSEFPVVAEFLIRNEGKSLFFEILGNSEPSPGLVVLLLQLEDLIVLNHQIFSEADYERLAESVESLSATTQKVNQRLHAFGHHAEFERWDSYGFNAASTFNTIVGCCNRIIELCRKARFLHLERSLTENMNLEINQDKYVVEDFLRRLGFSGPLATALNEAERLYVPGATEAELKSSVGHLRSFLEYLHVEAIIRVQQKKQIGPPSDQRWGTVLNYLHVNGLLLKKEEEYVAALYTVISDGGVHPLIARREHARLFRNVVIEYALLFLRKLEQLGVAKQPPAE